LDISTSYQLNHSPGGPSDDDAKALDNCLPVPPSCFFPGKDSEEAKNIEWWGKENAKGLINVTEGVAVKVEEEETWSLMDVCSKKSAGLQHYKVDQSEVITINFVADILNAQLADMLRQMQKDARDEGGPHSMCRAACPGGPQTRQRASREARPKVAKMTRRIHIVVNLSLEMLPSIQFYDSHPSGWSTS
jgi:hypothetical protein